MHNYLKLSFVLLSHKPKHGFTLIELLVVLAIVALLLTVSVPRYLQHVDVAKEVVLVENLRLTRDTIQRFYADTGRFPDSLEELVSREYLRAIPVDPITESQTTWQLVPPTDPSIGKLQIIQSGAPGRGRSGRLYIEY